MAFVQTRWRLISLLILAVHLTYSQQTISTCAASSDSLLQCACTTDSGGELAEVNCLGSGLSALPDSSFYPVGGARLVITVELSGYPGVQTGAFSHLYNVHSLTVTGQVGDLQTGAFHNITGTGSDEANLSFRNYGSSSQALIYNIEPEAFYHVHGFQSITFYWAQIDSINTTGFSSVYDVQQIQFVYTIINYIQDAAFEDVNGALANSEILFEFTSIQESVDGCAFIGLDNWDKFVLNQCSVGNIQNFAFAWMSNIGTFQLTSVSVTESFDGSYKGIGKVDSYMLINVQPTPIISADPALRVTSVAKATARESCTPPTTTVQSTSIITSDTPSTTSAPDTTVVQTTEADTTIVPTTTTAATSTYVTETTTNWRDTTTVVQPETTIGGGINGPSAGASTGEVGSGTTTMEIVLIVICLILIIVVIVLIILLFCCRKENASKSKVDPEETQTAQTGAGDEDDESVDYKAPRHISGGENYKAQRHRIGGEDYKAQRHAHAGEDYFITQNNSQEGLVPKKKQKKKKKQRKRYENKKEDLQRPTSNIYSIPTTEGTKHSQSFSAYNQTQSHINQRGSLAHYDFPGDTFEESTGDYEHVPRRSYQTPNHHIEPMYDNVEVSLTTTTPSIQQIPNSQGPNIYDNNLTTRQTTLPDNSGHCEDVAEQVLPDLVSTERGYSRSIAEISGPRQDNRGVYDDTGSEYPQTPKLLL